MTEIARTVEHYTSILYYHETIEYASKRDGDGCKWRWKWLYKTGITKKEKTICYPASHTPPSAFSSFDVPSIAGYRWSKTKRNTRL